MIVDGKALAEEIALELKEVVVESGLKLTLGVVVMNESPVTARYLERKKRIAEQIGISFEKISVSSEGGIEDVQTAVHTLVSNVDISGILVQLPLPVHIDVGAVLNLIPAERDPDVLSGGARKLFELGGGILPPVIAAMKEILDRNAVSLAGKKVVVVGEGNLVGKPAAAWAAAGGANVQIVTEQTLNSKEILVHADIIISGAGSPAFIKPEMLKQGVVLLDAGTTDVGGSLQGDADPACAEKCSIFTPVPGGIGPLTIVMIYKNLLALAKAQ